MTSVEDLLVSLAAIDASAEEVRSQLQYEAGEARSTRDRVSGSFGDQSQGHQAAMLLDTAAGQLLEVEGAVRSLRADMRTLAAKLRT